MIGNNNYLFFKFNEDDLEEYRIPNAIFLPAALLIHRCDRSVGYCHAPAHECASVESEEQVVTFHVKNLFTPSKPRLTSVTLRNHTRCRCVSIRSRTAGPSTGLPSYSLNDIPDEWRVIPCNCSETLKKSRTWDSKKKYKHLMAINLNVIKKLNIHIYNMQIKLGEKKYRPGTFY